MGGLRVGLVRILDLATLVLDADGPARCPFLPLLAVLSEAFLARFALPGRLGTLATLPLFPLTLLLFLQPLAVVIRDHCLQLCDLHLLLRDLCGHLSVLLVGLVELRDCRVVDAP